DARPTWNKTLLPCEKGSSGLLHLVCRVRQHRGRPDQERPLDCADWLLVGLLSSPRRGPPLIARADNPWKTSKRRISASGGATEPPRTGRRPTIHDEANPRPQSRT